MKSAEERANELLAICRRELTGESYRELVRAAAASFKDHARDQRHLCATSVLAVADRYAPGEVAVPRVMGSIAHYAVLNAPEPNSAE